MAEGIEQAKAALRSGRAVVFPTDTVYGLGVAVRYADSPEELYILKRRDRGKPIAWLVGDVGALDRYGVDVPREARELAASRWPGGLTLIVKASSSVPLAYQSSRGTIGLRMPAHETALALIRDVGPIATSSANVAGAQPPRAFADVAPEIAESAAAVVYDGTEGSGTPSTVLDFSQEEVAKLRG